MNVPRAFVPVALASAFLSAPGAHAQVSLPDTVLYSLASPPSEFQYGCFGPCACAVFVRSPLLGTFVLRKASVDPLYTWYDVVDVHWRVPDQTRQTTITGSGTYRRGGEVALVEELALDLSFDGGPLQHFTSGLHTPGAPFPEISTRISLHPQLCLDSVLVVDAKPYSWTTGVGGDGLRPSLAAAPNPFGSSTEIQFALAEPGLVSLAVFDLSGRRVRQLVTRQWLTTGPQTRSWDGRLDSGALAPAGLYFVRVDLPSGGLTRTIVKLE